MMHPEQQAIYWYSGLYLQPQHLQSVDLHHEWESGARTQLASPWHYGVAAMVLEPDALKNFIFDASELRVVMPDGTYLEKGSNCRLEKRSFRDAWQFREKPFTLWLALRRFNPGTRNAALLARENERVSTRWVTTGDETVMKDVYGDGPQTAIQRLQYNLRLMWDDEQKEAVDYDCIPLVRLIFLNDVVQHDPDFCPPAITLKGVEPLRKVLEGLFHELSQRARQLEEYKRPQGFRGDAEQIILLAMRTLNRTLPLFKHALEAAILHPHQLYGLLCQLVGELSTFNDRCTFLGEWREGEQSLLAWDHMQPIACFNSARKTIQALLNGLILEENTYVSLAKTAEGHWGGRLIRQQCEEAGTLLLTLRSSLFLDKNRRIEAINGLKLAAKIEMAAMVQYALPGLVLEHCPLAPRGIPAREDAVWYKIHRDSEHWLKAMQSGELAFYWAEAPADLDVQIIFMDKLA